MMKSLINRYNLVFAFCQREFLNYFEKFIISQQNALVLWVPVLMGLGIGLFFSLEEDPSIYWCILTFITGIHSIKSKNMVSKTIVASIFWISLGFSTSIIRTNNINTNFISKKLNYKKITGIITNIESHKSGLRITIKANNLENNYLRFVIKEKYLPKASLSIGDEIKTKATLHPPSLPNHPNGFNFRRNAYFQKLSATGYATDFLYIESKHQQNLFKSFIDRAKQKIRLSLKNNLSDKTKPVALAMTIGERSAVPDEIRSAYSNSGISHLLAISGLHLTIIAGFIFFFIRRGLCLSQYLSLKYNTKKIAAIIAFIFTAFYLMLCWGSISALRAFIMTSIVFLAILIDRKAITLRSVAIAATGILIFLPESLLTPSFQLSFAAVTGIVAFYQSIKPSYSNNLFKKITRFFVGIFLTTVIATTVTIPFTIYHFQQISIHGLWVNVLAIPLTALLLMPLLFCYTILIPFDLSSFLSLPLEKVINFLNNIAFFASDLPFFILKTYPISNAIFQKQLDR